RPKKARDQPTGHSDAEAVFVDAEGYDSEGGDRVVAEWARRGA
ncbi:MAG: hypothetical protein RL701_7886, partial [Pseudomonadota bacterium]